MNCIQQLLICGSHQSGCLESCADCMNLCPAYLWQERNVIVYKRDDLECREDRKSLFYCDGDFCIFGLVFFTVPCIFTAAAFALATPCLGCGLCLKQIALSQDPTAKEYNKLAAKYLNQSDVRNSVNNEIIGQNANLSHNTEKLEKLQHIASVIRKDIENNCTGDGKPFMGTSPNFMIGYTPIITENKISDYKISTFNNSIEPKIPETVNGLSYEIYLLTEENKRIETELAKLEARKQTIQQPNEFLAQVKKIYPSETEPLIKS